MTTGGRKPVEVSIDEHPRPGTTMQALAGLRPAFEKDGSVTAGNSSGINDGAAATVLMREDDVRARGLTGLATLEAVTTAGVDPEIMGYAPVIALQRLWERTGLTPADVDVIEVNEAFAAQAVAVIRDAGLDPERVNPYGGGDRPRPPRRRDRRDPDRARGPRSAAPRPRVRRRDDVHRRRPGPRGVAAAVLTPARASRQDASPRGVPERQKLATRAKAGTRDTGPMSVFLLGGGRDVAVCASLLQAFVSEAREHAAGRAPVIALLLVLEAHDDASVDRFRGVLEAAERHPTTSGCTRSSRERPSRMP